jgi:hypothetical protein
MNKDVLFIKDERRISSVLKKKLFISCIEMDTVAELYLWRKHHSKTRYLQKGLQGQQCPKNSHFLALSLPSIQG